MKPRFAIAFDRGQTPTISVVDRAKTPYNVQALIPALQSYVNNHIGRIWGVACNLIYRRNGVIPKGDWGMVFLDNTDQADALAYHELTPALLPSSNIYVKTTLDAGEDVAVSASHELAEMLVDPGLNLGAQNNQGDWYALEVCDAVQASSFDILGFQMSNFQYPAWFEPFRKAKSTQFDHLNRTTKPFQIAKNGYMPVYKNGHWTTLGRTNPRNASFRVSRRIKQ